MNLDETIDPELILSWQAILDSFLKAFPGSRIDLIQGYRTPAYQASLGKKGNSPYNGTTTFSKHQFFPARAMDFAVVDKGKYITNGQDHRYGHVGDLIRINKDIIWGGHFKKPDWDHIELVGPNPTAQEVTAGFKAFTLKI